MKPWGGGRLLKQKLSCWHRPPPREEPCLSCLGLIIEARGLCLKGAKFGGDSGVSGWLIEIGDGLSSIFGQSGGKSGVILRVLSDEGCKFGVTEGGSLGVMDGNLRQMGKGWVSAMNDGHLEWVQGVGVKEWRRAWQSTPVSLPGESHGQRSLAGYSPWGHRESDTT